MRLQSKFAMIALVFVPVVVFLAYNSLSASIPGPEPFASFERPAEAKTATFIPAPVKAAPKKAWSGAVRNVLDQVENLESRLELYSAQLEAVESRRIGKEVASRLELDRNNPGKAIEQVLGRFSAIVDAYAALDESSKAQIHAMNQADRVDALGRVAEADEEFNAYLDRLAVIRERKVAQDRENEMAAFEAVLIAGVAAKSAVEAIASEAYVHAIARSAELAGREALEKATEAFLIGKAVQAAGLDSVSAFESSPANTPHAPLK